MTSSNTTTHDYFVSVGIFFFPPFSIPLLFINIFTSSTKMFIMFMSVQVLDRCVKDDHSVGHRNYCAVNYFWHSNV